MGPPILVALATPDELIESVHRVLHAAFRAKLLEHNHDDSPTFFELLIVYLLAAMGHGGGHKNAAEQLGRSGDGIITDDRFGLDRICMQTKRCAEGNSIQRSELQGFVGPTPALSAPSMRDRSDGGR